MARRRRNFAIQEADLLIALGMRFDDRVTGNLKTYSPNSKKIHVDIDASEINKNVRVDVGIEGDLRTVLSQIMPGVVPTAHPEWLNRIRDWQEDAQERDIIFRESTGKLLWRAGDQRPVACNRRRRHYRERCGPAPDARSPVLPAHAPVDADHQRRPGDHGLWPAGGDRREVRPAG